MMTLERASEIVSKIRLAGRRDATMRDLAGELFEDFVELLDVVDVVMFAELCGFTIFEVNNAELN